MLSQQPRWLPPLLAILLIASLGAKIEGPTEVGVSHPAVFKISGVPAEHQADLNWGVFPRSDDGMVLDLMDRAGNPVLIFWTRTSGKYVLFADVNVPANYELILHEFTVGKPPDPPPPDPPEGWAKWTRDKVTELVPQKGRAEVARRLASAMQSTLDGYEKGTLQSVEGQPVKSLPQLRAALRQWNARALGGDRPDWEGFLGASKVAFQTLLDEGSLSSREEWFTLWTAVIEGLKKVE